MSTPRLPPSVCEIRSISCVFIWSFLRGRSSSSSVKKQCVQRISQTDVTRMFSNTGENGWPIASFAYRFNNSLVVKSISNSNILDKLFEDVLSINTKNQVMSQFEI